MKTAKVNIKGMSRMLPQNLSDDGLSRDVINMRYYNGAWRPIGEPVQVATGAEAGMVSYIHLTTDNNEFLVTYDSVTGYIKFKPLTSGSYANIADIGTGKTVRFSSLHNVLFAFDETDEEILYVLYDLTDQEYRYIGEDAFPDVLDIRFKTDGDPQVYDEMKYLLYNDYSTDDERAKAAEALLFALEGRANKDGLFTGYVALVFAYELFDGSIVKHSHIRHVKCGQWQWRIAAGGTPVIQVQLMTEMFLYDIRTLSSDIENIQDKYKNIIKSVNVYMTRPLNPYILDPSEWTGTMSEVGAMGASKAYDAIINQRQFRLIKKIALDELAEADDNEITFPDITGIDTFEGLPIDNFSHHKLYSKSNYRYNNRIFHGDVTMSLYKGYDPLRFIRSYVFSDPGDAYKVWFEVEIKDIDGIKIARSEIVEYNQYYTPDATEFPILYLLNFMYPDGRASVINVYWSDETDVHLARSIPLTTHPTLNMSYVLGNLEINGSTFDSNTLMAYSYSNLPDVRSILTSPNRIQASEVDNPFFFPARNSYQVGHGPVIGMAANTLLIETGQFGEYPLYVFTREGVWTMNFSASGDILIDSIKPAAMDVCTNRDSILGTPFGVIFVSGDRLMIISGMKAVKISGHMEGNYLSPLANNLDYKDTISLVEDFIENDSFEDYLAGSKVAFNSIKNELIISNVGFPYSLLFSLESHSYYKVGWTFNQFLNLYPNLLAEYEGILYDVTNEAFMNNTPVFIESYPIKLDIDVFKKIESLAVRGLIDGLGIVNLFGSVDGIRWYNLLHRETTGLFKDIVTRRAEYSCVQYIVCFSGLMGEGGYLTHLDFSYKVRFDSKMR